MEKYEEMSKRVEGSYQQWSQFMQDYQVIDDKVFGTTQLKFSNFDRDNKNKEHVEKKDGQIQVIYRPIIVADENQNTMNTTAIPDLEPESLHQLMDKINHFLGSKDAQKIDKKIHEQL